MKTIAYALATLLIVACSAPPVQQDALAANAKATSPIIVATLATNACEARTAPVYTAAIVATERGRRYFQAGQLAASDADQLIALGRSAKADLDAACPGKVLDAARLAAAEDAVRKMQAILGGVR